MPYDFDLYLQSTPCCDVGLCTEVEVVCVGIQMSSECGAISCFVVHWCVAVSASAVGLMFVGKTYVIVGEDPLMLELLVGPVSGGVVQ